MSNSKEGMTEREEERTECGDDQQCQIDRIAGRGVHALYAPKIRCTLDSSEWRMR
jgi:hypothetical protein